MDQNIKINLDDTKQLALISKALSSKTRIEILRQLRYKDLNVNEIAEILSIPASSSAAHVNVLVESGLIKTTLLPGIRGSMKVCHILLDQINIDLNPKKVLNQKEEIIQMPIGNYVDYMVKQPCGIVSSKGPIGPEDEPRCYFHPERIDAQLIWLGHGYIEYRFPTNSIVNKEIMSLEISMELCSEDHEYNMNYPSDLTLWVNGLEAGTWTCPSDFGGRRGKLNPSWWPDKNSQFGLLKTWKLTNHGCFLDEVKSGNKIINDFGIDQYDYISVRIGIKDNAEHKGGLNLYGECFGDYAQNIVMKIIFM